MKRSFHRRERETFINELRYWNECLKNVFEKIEIPSDESDHLVERSQVRYNQGECEMIRQKVHLVYRALESVSWSCHCPEHWGSIRLCWLMEKTISAAKLNISFSSCQGPTGWQSMTIRVEEKEKQISKPQAISMTVPPDSLSVLPSMPPPRLKKLKGILGLSQQARICPPAPLATGRLLFPSVYL